MHDSGLAGRVVADGTKTLISGLGKVSKGPTGAAELRGLLIRVNSAGYRELRQLALDEDRTLQSLAVEALNDLLRSRGLKPVIKNPLRQDD